MLVILVRATSKQGQNWIGGRVVWVVNLQVEVKGAVRYDQESVEEFKRGKVRRSTSC